MATFRRVEEIEVWQHARDLTKEIYIVTNLEHNGPNKAAKHR